jgi:hypothetical protein
MIVLGRSCVRNGELRFVDRGTMCDGFSLSLRAFCFFKLCARQPYCANTYYGSLLY